MERLVTRFDLGVMGGNLFQKITQQEFYIRCPTQEKPLKFAENAAFEGAYKVYLLAKVAELNRVLGSSDEGAKRKELITLMANYVFYTKLFKKTDMKIFKSIWLLQKKAPIIQIAGHILFKSESFMRTHCTSEAGHKLDPKDMRQYRADYIKALDAAFISRVEELQAAVTEWCAKISSFALADLPGAAKGAEELNRIFKAIVSGVKIAGQVKVMIDDMLLLHYTEGVNLSQPLLLPIIKAIAMLKGIDFEISSKITQIALLTPLIRRVIQNQLQVVWEDTLSSIEKQEKSDWRDFLTYSFETALNCTRLELNSTHVKFLSLLQPVLCSKELVKPKLHEPLVKYYERLVMLENLQKNLYYATHVVYFYKIRSYSFLFFEILSQNAVNVYLLKYLLRAFEDSKRLLDRVAYLEEKDLLMKQYKSELLNTFHDTIISPLVETVEGALRARAEANYTVKKEDNPMKDHTIDIKYFLKCEPLFLFGERISIGSTVEEQLTRRFYNLAAGNLSNWQLCEDMRCAARSLYGLAIQENLLPPKKTQQGLDVIDIAKKLQLFVGSYHYSLHTQAFFERISVDKDCINVFGVGQAVNSFCTHGMGIRSTVLSAIYKLVGR